MKNYLHITLQVILLFTAFSVSLSSHAQDWNQIMKANAGDRNDKPTGSRSKDDYYGWSVAIAGNYAVVGARSEEKDMNGENEIEHAGAAYVLELINGKWKQVKKLSASHRNFASFGYAVAMDGDYIVVGAENEWHGNSPLDPHFMTFGAVYIFKKDEGGEGNWGEVTRIEGTKNNGGGAFGKSVAIKGNYLVVGAPNEGFNVGAANEVVCVGAAYIYKRDQGGTGNWGLVKRLVDTDRKTFDQFGTAVAINGDDIAIGIPSDEVKDANNMILERAGAVCIYNKYQGGTDNWGQTKKITEPDPGPYNSFGGIIAMEGNDMVIGHYVFGNGSGKPESAYVFEKNQGGTGNWGVIKKLVAPTPAKGDYFGQSVGIGDGYIIVGAVQEDGSNSMVESGSAYIFKKNQGGNKNWGLVKKLTAPNPEHFEFFGKSVAISGEHALVGVPQEDDDEFEKNNIMDAGAAYFYQKEKGGNENWGFTRKTITEERTPDDNYGYSVAISGDLAVVGSPYEDQDRFGKNTIPDAGAAYILRRSAGNWVQVRKLTPIIRGSHDNFGSSVAIKGDYVIVGAPKYDMSTAGNQLKDVGSAYVFYANQGPGNWGQVCQLVAANGQANDLFGYAVSIGDNVAVVGAPNTGGTSGEQNLGSAYVFEKDQNSGNWAETKELTAVTRVANAYFGHSVSISGNYIIAGAHSDNHNGKGAPVIGAGAAYLFRKNPSARNTWIMQNKLVASDPNYNDRFGYSVAINGDYAIVGAYADSENSQNAGYKPFTGSAYIFKKDTGGNENWGQVKKLVAEDQSDEDLFGVSVSISENYAIVGAHYEDENAMLTNTREQSGSAYIFRKNLGGDDNWGQDQKITADDRHVGDQFGISVAINETYAIVGSPFDKTGESGLDALPGSGSVYLFYNSALTTTPVFDKKLARMAATGADAHEISEEHQKIGLYPNPVVDKIYVGSDQINQIDLIRVVNTTGHVVAAVSKITAAGLDVGHLAPGIYVLQIKKTDGKVQTDRVMIVR
ncbi:T9SS type A sorting domain-containing protein [Dyadobacter diqingensis]|uniref:T9SS type A sorting domain-containing protein n=1 Tax=Dyadobacter diqingensis TaxID=2938121 RepID=UPI0020C1FBDA|nr:T9SS type A sorting domain-containing protein [Dyadobacter diqingensis]